MILDLIMTPTKKLGVTSSEKLLLVQMFILDSDQLCDKSMSTLSKETGLSMRTIGYAVKSLSDKKLIKILKSSDGEQGNCYSFNQSQFDLMTSGKKTNVVNVDFGNASFAHGAN